MVKGPQHKGTHSYSQSCSGRRVSLHNWLLMLIRCDGQELEPETSKAGATLPPLQFWYKANKDIRALCSGNHHFQVRLTDISFLTLLSLHFRPASLNHCLENFKDIWRVLSFSILHWMGVWQTPCSVFSCVGRLTYLLVETVILISRSSIGEWGIDFLLIDSSGLR